MLVRVKAIIQFCNNDMERKRVFEIKKRFEELDQHNALKNGNTSIPKLPVFQTGKISNNFGNKSFLKEGAWENECDVRNVKKPLEKASSLEGSTCGKNVIRRSHAFRSSKNDFTPQKGKNVGPNVGQNAKDGWKPTLPPGPAPKKPPRTFAHKIGDSPSLPNCSMSESVQNGKPSFKRSKTEPLIMLKKLETALKVHQNTQNGGKRSLPVNGNVYDVPYDVQKPGMSLPVSTFKSPVEPVYSEPCVVKPKALTPPAPQASKSLYYMVSCNNNNESCLS